MLREGLILTEKNKVTNPKKLKRGFEPNLYKAVINFFNHDDVSTALPRKHDAKKIKQGKTRIQKQKLNNYLSNLHQKFVFEHQSNMSCSFTSFARMRPKNFVMVNFADRRTCLRTIHPNYDLKLKMLRKYPDIPTNPEAFVKYCDQKISSSIDNITQQDFKYNIWKKLCTRKRNIQKMKRIT